MMGMFGARVPARWLAGSAAVAILIGGAAPAFAQEGTDARLKKVEAEVRALQRKVFPGADGKYFEPEIQPNAVPKPMPGQPAGTPVTDLLTRMDAAEAQMARLTAQVEQNTNRIAQLEAKLVASAPPPVTPAPMVPAPAGVPQRDLSPAAVEPARPAPTPLIAAAKPATAPKPSGPTAARIEAVAAIVKPQSSDPGEDEYSYGYRLWEARFYPEAQQQLKLYLQKYPKHARISWARNLLGRAYLEDGNPNEAAKWFVQNYQADKRGERSPDSLLYLAVTMKQMKDSKRACIALAEFSEQYAAEAAGRLGGLYKSTLNGLTCS